METAVVRRIIGGAFHGGDVVAILQLHALALGQLVVAGGLLDLFQPVGAVGKTLNGDGSITDGNNIIALFVTNSRAVGVVIDLGQLDLLAALLRVVELELCPGKEGVACVGLYQIKLVSRGAGGLFGGLAVVAVVQLYGILVDTIVDDRILVQGGAVGDKDVGVTGQLVQYGLVEGDGEIVACARGYGIVCRGSVGGFTDLNLNVVVEGKTSRQGIGENIAGGALLGVDGHLIVDRAADGGVVAAHQLVVLHDILFNVGNGVLLIDTDSGISGGKAAQGAQGGFHQIVAQSQTGEGNRTVGCFLTAIIVNFLLLGKGKCLHRKFGGSGFGVGILGVHIAVFQLEIGGEGISGTKTDVCPLFAEGVGVLTIFAGGIAFQIENTVDVVGLAVGSLVDVDAAVGGSALCKGRQDRSAEQCRCAKQHQQGVEDFFHGWVVLLSGWKTLGMQFIAAGVQPLYAVLMDGGNAVQRQHPQEQLANDLAFFDTADDAAAAVYGNGTMVPHDKIPVFRYLIGKTDVALAKGKLIHIGFFQHLTVYRHHPVLVQGDQVSRGANDPF